MNRATPPHALGRLPDAPPCAPSDLDAMAALAWEAYAALSRQESAQPDLRTNGYWRALRDAAYARFRAVFEASI